jgi:hypothetical protein
MPSIDQEITDIDRATEKAFQDETGLTREEIVTHALNDLKDRSRRSEKSLEDFEYLEEKIREIRSEGNSAVPATNT